MFLTTLLFPLSITVILIILVIVLIAKGNESTHREMTTTEAQTFLILGLCFFPFGIVMWLVLDQPGFIGVVGMGFTFLIIGLSNQQKEEK